MNGLRLQREILPTRKTGHSTLHSCRRCILLDFCAREFCRTLGSLLQNSRKWTQGVPKFAKPKGQRLAHSFLSCWNVEWKIQLNRLKLNWTFSFWVELLCHFCVNLFATDFSGSPGRQLACSFHGSKKVSPACGASWIMAVSSFLFWGDSAKKCSLLVSISLVWIELTLFFTIEFNVCSPCFLSLHWDFSSRFFYSVLVSSRLVFFFLLSYSFFPSFVFLRVPSSSISSHILFWKWKERLCHQRVFQTHLLQGRWYKNACKARPDSCSANPKELLPFEVVSCCSYSLVFHSCCQKFCSKHRSVENRSKKKQDAKSTGGTSDEASRRNRNKLS